MPDPLDPLKTTEALVGFGVLVGSGVKVEVGVAVSVAVGVAVKVAVAVGVNVAVAVLVAVGVDEAINSCTAWVNWHPANTGMIKTNVNIVINNFLFIKFSQKINYESCST